MKCVIHLFLLCFIQFANAQTQTLPSCTDPSVDLRTVSIGYKCITSKSGVFERVEHAHFLEAWKFPNGMIWSEILETNRLEHAEEICFERNAFIPSADDFKAAIAVGMKEVLSPGNTFGLWTSTAYDDPRYFGYKYYYYHSATEKLSWATKAVNFLSVSCVAQ